MQTENRTLYLLHLRINAQTLKGYQIKGIAEYVTKGDIVDAFKATVDKYIACGNCAELCYKQAPVLVRMSE